MTDKLLHHANVSYADVDRHEVMSLTRVFKLLQEAAILHANQFGTGTNAMATRGESWVLNRMAVAIDRYPRHGENLRVATWSSGIKGFKGFRDFRVYDANEQPIVSASSLWLYISLQTKSIVRVPREVAATFPVCSDAAWCPELEKLPVELPAAGAAIVPTSLRYSDFDANDHVNNAAYADFLQSALARVGAAAQPRRVLVKYARAIPSSVHDVTVRLEPVGAATRFSIERDGQVFAQGETQA